jgi:hypothetical protein
MRVLPGPALAMFAAALLAAACSCSSPRPMVAASAPSAPDTGATEAPVGAGPESPDVESEIAIFREYLKTRPEPPALRNRVVDFTLRPDPRKVGPLKPLLSVREFDDEVRVVACRGIGRMGDPAAATLLLAVAEDKSNRHRPGVVAAALEGVGNADPRGLHGQLVRFAKTHLDRDAVIATAALHAAARVPSNELVDDLVRMLEQVSVESPSDGAVRRAAHDAVRPVLIELLRGLTGAEAKDARAWREWWAGRKRTWKPCGTGSGSGEPGGDRPGDGR